VDETEFVKPKPPLHAMHIRELRDVVIARHKFLATMKPVEEAVKLIQEEYGADDDSCLRFVEWLRGGSAGEPPTKGTSIERIHVATDPETGNEERVDTRPGSVPPEPS
jgi:hypothetical protein